MAALVATLSLFAPAARAADAEAIQPAERLLFMADHLKTLRRGESDLVYHFDKSGGLLPAQQQEVHVKLSRSAQGLGAVVNDGSGAAPIALEAPVQGNPVILYFLEQDIAEMHRLTGGQPRYFQKRIRLALAQGPQISAVSERFDGQALAAQQIVIQPYLDDPQQSRFANLAGKRYTFVLSDRVPGQVLLLKSEVPGRRAVDAAADSAVAAQDFDQPLQTETLRLRGAKP